MEETIEQKIIRNVQGQFAIYKTTEVVGDKANVPNVEWEESEAIDKFFMFAKNLGAKVIYLTEGEEENEAGETTTTIVQVGFLHQGIMHHIDFSEEDDDEDEYDEDDEEYDEEEGDEDGEYEDDDAEGESEPNAEQPVAPTPAPSAMPTGVPQQQAQSNQFIGGNLGQ